MVSGPLAGYFAGEWLNRKILPGKYTALIFTLIGLLASLTETVRIIKVIVKSEKGL